MSNENQNFSAAQALNNGPQVGSKYIFNVVMDLIEGVEHEDGTDISPVCVVRSAVPGAIDIMLYIDGTNSIMSLQWTEEGGDQLTVRVDSSSSLVPSWNQEIPHYSADLGMDLYVLIQMYASRSM